MRSEPNSVETGRAGVKELRAIRKYPDLEGLIAAIEDAIIEGGASGPGPPQPTTTQWLVASAMAIGRRAARSPLGKFTTEDLWFIALSYLEIRGTQMRWYELSSDDHAYLSWFLAEGAEHHEDDVLTVREHLLVALRERDMRAPHHFFPLLSAAM